MVPNFKVMRALTYLPAVFFVLSIPLSAQSIFLDSLRNAFSATAHYSTAENYKGSSIDLGYTINGKTDLGLTLGYETDVFDLKTNSPIRGKSIGLNTGFSLFNELSGDPLGLQLNLLYKHTFYNELNGDDRLVNSEFGIGMQLSKNASAKIPGLFYHLFGVTAYPFSQTKLDAGRNEPYPRYNFDYYRNEGRTFTNQRVTGYYSPSINLGYNHSGTFSLILQPRVSHNFSDNITFFTISATTLF